MPTLEPDLREVFAATDRVVVFGDIHGDATAFRLTASRAVGDLRLTRVLVSVGDFGFGLWGGHDDKILNRAESLLEQLDAFCIVVPGNHDDQDWINETLTSRRDGLGFGVGGRHGRVRIAPRGHRWTMGGRRFGSLGGAVSVDQRLRRQGRDWWPEEEPTAADVDELGDEPLDVLVTHDVPDEVPLVGRGGWPPELVERSNRVRVLLREAVDRTRPDVVFSGHWHVRLTHSIERADGGTTRVEVLDAEHTPGNAVALDLLDDELRVSPLPELWRRHMWSDGDGR